MEYEVVIGLEVHAQLLTRTKMFCGCSAGYQDASPNSYVCPVCLGMPGVLPVINQQAVELVVRTGLALNCTIARQTKFDRKNYPYPDLMKGYQISQYDRPIASGGSLEVETDGRKSSVGITRVHLEEDVAKLLHRSKPYGERYSLLDINRAGVPLMEVVSEPDIRSPEEARSYLTKLRSILRYIQVSTANMEEGSFRCDANISIRPQGSSELGPKVEVKNMNSFRSVYGALRYETKRQTERAGRGDRIVQETRGWVEESGVTVSQRTKEYASDYRYFPEPDLPPVVIEPSLVEEIGRGMPELPDERKARFISQYGLPEYDAGLLSSARETADLFEAALSSRGRDGGVEPGFAKSVGNWILGEFFHLLSATRTDLADTKIRPGQLAELVGLVEDGTLSSSMAKSVFEEMFETGAGPAEIAERSGMVQIGDADVIMSAVEEAIEANPKPVADYLDGKTTALRYLMGQVMRITKGRANPADRDSASAREAGDPECAG